MFLDKAGGDPRSGNVGRLQLDRIRADFRLIDAFRFLFPNRRAFTYTGHNSSSRLDRFYFDSRHADCISQVSIIPSTFTDHCIVALELTQVIFASHMSGPGYWKCNTSSLSMGELHKEIGGVWDILKRSPIKNAMWWENCKFLFKKTLRSFSIWQARLRRERFLSLNGENFT